MGHVQLPRERAGVPNKRRRMEDDDDNYTGMSRAESTTQDNKMMSTLGKSTGQAAGSGSAWEGQQESLATDRFMHHQHGDMKNDVHHHLSVTAHVMDQGGPICSGWTNVPGVPDIMKFSMGFFTGNQMSGQANEFNQYYLCKMKSFTITFKDIIVTLEASTSVGLTTMADVVTEWRRRPLPGNWNALPLGQAPPDPAEYPDWWQDWRPAVDGAVSFKFHVNSRRVPAWLANAMHVIPTVAQRRDPTLYRSLRQFLFGTSQLTNFVATGTNAGDFNTSPPQVPMEMCAFTSEWLDFFFEWRARNCPNTQSGTNTAARYNIQIDTEWEMSYRLSALTNTNYPPPSNYIDEYYDDIVNDDE